MAFKETGQEIFWPDRLQRRPHGIWTIGRKFCYRLLLCFLLPATFIGCRSGVLKTSPSQTEVATPSPTPDQAKEGSGVEFFVSRFTMKEGGAEFRLVYDWRERKCFAQLASKDDPTDLDKETVETIFTEDDCFYPYSIHHYIGSGKYPQLVVLGRGVGGTCPATYRIVEFPHDDPGFVVTESFGNCSSDTTLSFDGKKLTIKVGRQYFRPADVDVYADPETWVYSNKKLRQVKTAKRRR